ncbi:MAG: hypothetical protein ACTSWR_09125 [Candidatus Helarchaeota archaeon]
MEFESIHLKCKSCLSIFQVVRDKIVKGLSITGDVLGAILLLYYDFENSAEMIVKLMGSLYSVKLKRSSVLKWIKIYGTKYCQKSNTVFREDSKVASDYFGANGTFPKLKFLSDTDLKGKYIEKKSGCALIISDRITGRELMYYLGRGKD